MISRCISNEISIFFSPLTLNEYNFEKAKVEPKELELGLFIGIFPLSSWNMGMECLGREWAKEVAEGITWSWVETIDMLVGIEIQYIILEGGCTWLLFHLPLVLCWWD